MKLVSFIKKECLLIGRDVHALLVLFAMPIIFILIISLALQNSFSGKVDRKYQVALLSENNIGELDSLTFDMQWLTQPKLIASDLLYKDKFDFVLTLTGESGEILIHTKPSIAPRYASMLKAELMLLMQEKRIEALLKKANLEQGVDTGFKVHYLSKKGEVKTSNSVDHSVPSWLIFSMYFILLPISNTFMNERAFGTFDRLKSMHVSTWTILLGKFIPYLIVNLFQVFIIFIFGLYVMPLLGLDKLNIRGGIGLILLISLCTSIAAIAFGLLIANVAKSSEEAATIGGVSNIIFASIGGIMVPKFVMPEAMQKVSEFSPMSWSLESFLSVLVRGESANDIMSDLMKLFTFAVVCLFSSYLLLRKKESSR